MKCFDPTQEFPVLWEGYILTLSRAVQIASKRVEAMLAKRKMTLRDVWILMCAREHPCAQEVIAKTLGINRNVMVVCVDNLERKRLITRNANPENRREKLVTITEKGRACVQAIAKQREAMSVEAFRPLTGEELNRIRDLAHRVVAAYYTEPTSRKSRPL